MPFDAIHRKQDDSKCVDRDRSLSNANSLSGEVIVDFVLKRAFIKERCFIKPIHDGNDDESDRHTDGSEIGDK